MIAVIQRVNRASVAVDGVVTGKCQAGLMVLLGVTAVDEKLDAELLSAKIAKLRIFEDENGKMNRSIRDIGGEMLVVSQFTLLADTSHGNRPSFFGAGDPTHAEALYEYFIERIRMENIPVESGVFGADMEVTIINDGPVTLVLNSEDYKKSV